MAKRSLQSELRLHVDAFLGEVSDLIRRHALESVHAMLDELGNPSGRSGRRSTNAAPRRRLRMRRSAAQVDALTKRVVAHVRAHPGQALVDIAQGLDVSTEALKLPVAKLMSARALRTEGKKRGAKYFAGGRTSARDTPRAKRKRSPR
jgi:hypothetical protein